MSTKLEALRQQVEAAVNNTGIDLTVTTKGGSAPRLLPEGYALGRLVGYVEYGMQPREFGGKPQDPAILFHLEFALFGEGYANPDGSPVVLRTYADAISNNERSRCITMFNLLNWKKTAKSFPQLLGEPFLVPVINVPRRKGDTQLVSRIDVKRFLPPIDAVSKRPYDIPEAPDDVYRLFLWSHPTLEGWESLKIEGVDDDGNSRDFVRNTILQALDFQGSALQQLLQGAGLNTIPDPSTLSVAKPTQAPAAAPATPNVAAPIVPPAQAVNVAPAGIAVPSQSPVAAAPVAPVAPAVPAAPVVPPLAPAAPAAHNVTLPA